MSFLRKVLMLSLLIHLMASMVTTVSAAGIAKISDTCELLLQKMGKGKSTAPKLEETQSIDLEADGTYTISDVSHNHSQTFLYDSATRKRIKIEMSESMSVLGLEKDADYIVVRVGLSGGEHNDESQSALRFYDRHTLELKKTMRIPKQALIPSRLSADPSSTYSDDVLTSGSALDAKSGVVVFADGKDLVIGAAKQANRVVRLPAKPTDIILVNGSDMALVAYAKRSPQKVNLLTGEKTDVIDGLASQNLTVLRQSPDGHYLFIAAKIAGAANFVRVDMVGSEHKTWPTPGPEPANTVASPRGVFYTTTSKTRFTAKYLDFASGIKETLESRPKSAPNEDESQEPMITRDGNRIIWTTQVDAKPAIFIHEIHGGYTGQIALGANESLVRTRVSPSGKKILFFTSVNTQLSSLKIFDVTLKTVTSYRISRSDFPSEWEFLDEGKLISRTEEGSVVLDLSDSSSAEKNIAKVTRGTKAEALQLAKKIKRGTLDVYADSSAIKNFFAAGLYKRDTDTLWALLFEMKTKAPVAFDSAMGTYPDLWEILKEKNIDLSLFPSATVNRWRRLTLRSVVKEANAFHQSDLFKNLHRFVIYRPFLAAMTPAQKDSMVDAIMDPIMENAMYEYRGIFPSKVHLFVRQQLAPLFGFPGLKVTDFVLVRDQDINTKKTAFKPMILSTSPIERDSSPATPYGFYIKSLPPIPVDFPKAKESDVIAKNVVRWSTNGQQFSADYTVTQGKPSLEIAPVTASFDYDSIWRDKELNGLIFTGSNLQADAATTVSQYLEYFKKSGYTFDRGTNISDFKAWLQKGIENGTIDYLDKEAHAGGMDQELVSVFQAGRILTGVKKLKDGRVEKISIWIADPKKPAATIANSEFGEWIKKRHEDPKNGQLVYFNTSCWGVTKAINELSAADVNGSFVDIASIDMADEFYNSNKYALQALLTGFRAGKSYNDIIKMMMADPTYKNHTANTYILPNQPEFQTHIRDVMPIAHAINIQVRDSAGRPYRLEDHSVNEYGK